MIVEIPDNLNSYKSRSITSLSKRQIKYLAGGIVIFIILAVVTFLTIPDLITASICLLPAAVISVAFVLCGFVTFMGLTLGETIRRALRRDYRPYRKEKKY